MPNPYSGSCLCGAVRYTVSAEPLATGNCHCRNCQKSAGAPFSSAFLIRQDALQLTGELKYYERTSDTGNTVRRAFCPTCGTPLFSASTGMPDILVMKITGLDHADAIQPMMDIYTESAQAWTRMDPALPKFPRMPPI